VTDLLEVEVVGEAPAARSGESPGAPAWGLPAAVAVFGFLALAFIVVVVGPAMSGSSAAPTVATPISPPGTDSELVETTREALSEWGRFAVTGDVGVLTGHFHPDGPQYRQLVREAPALVAANRTGQAYQVASRVTVKERLSDRAVVAARVVWERRGEPAQRMTWSVELRPTAAANWALWTVGTSRA